MLFEYYSGEIETEVETEIDKSQKNNFKSELISFLSSKNCFLRKTNYSTNITSLFELSKIVFDRKLSFFEKLKHYSRWIKLRKEEFLITFDSKINNCTIHQFLYLIKKLPR